MDRRHFDRFELAASAAVLTLRDVHIETACAQGVTVLASAPSPVGTHAHLRVTGARGREVLLKVRTTACAATPAAGGRRFRITYAVVGQEHSC